MTAEGIELRAATPADVPLILELIRELAAYERLADRCVADEESLRRWLFGPDPAAHVTLAFLRGEPAGYALYFRNFSTFLACPGIYLEDLFVRPHLRGHGVGLALLRHLAAYAADCGYARLEWSVLKWNKLAIDFYTELGAESLDEWTNFRLSGDALARLVIGPGESR